MLEAVRHFVEEMSRDENPSGSLAPDRQQLPLLDAPPPERAVSAPAQPRMQAETDQQLALAANQIMDLLIWANAIDKRLDQMDLHVWAAAVDKRLDEIESQLAMLQQGHQAVSQALLAFKDNLLL